MSKERRKHSPTFKAKVALEAWKKALLGGAADVFDGKQDKRQKSDDALVARLYQQIGQLKVEPEVLWTRRR